MGMQKKIPPQRDLLIIFFGTLANDLHRKAEGQGKGYSLPDGLFFEKRQQHHHKAKGAYYYSQGIFFREILFHRNRIYTRRNNKG